MGSSRAGRQDDVPPSCTFPLYCLRRFTHYNGVYGNQSSKYGQLIISERIDLLSIVECPESLL